jgi:hypothetical protein
MASLWDGFKALFSRSKREGTGFEMSRWSAAPPRRGSEALLRAYKTMPWLQTLVDTTSEGVADLRWKVVRPTKRENAKGFRAKLSGTLEERRERLKSMIEAGEAVEVPDHGLLQLLCDPNDHLTGRQVQKLKQIYLDLIGEAPLVLEMRSGVPVGYWILPPYAVTAFPDWSKPPAERFYTVTFGKLSRLIPASQVVMLRHPDPDDPLGRGIGKGFALGDELDTDEYAARFAKNYFYNSAIPAAVVTIEGMPAGDTPAAKRWKEDLKREHQGADNAGKVLVTGGKVSVARLDTDFQKMDLNALRKGLRDFARMNFKVPPEIVGDLTSSNKATAWAAGDALARNAIVPRGEFLRSEYQKRLMPFFGEEGDVLEFESPVPADKELELRVMGLFPSSFTHDEARTLAGKKPDPNLKGYLAPLPGQVEAGPKTPDAEQGGEADTIEEQDQPSNKKGAGEDPPWASAPL